MANVPIISEADVVVPSDYIVSAITTSSLKEWYVRSQSLEFKVVRQNYIMPVANNFFDANTVGTPTTPPLGLPTHNRIIVYGTLFDNIEIQSNTAYSTNVKVFQYFSTSGAASGSNYTSGVGSIYTTQPALVIREKLEGDFPYSKLTNFTFTLEHGYGPYDGSPLSVSVLIRKVAEIIKKRYSFNFDISLLKLT